MRILMFGWEYPPYITGGLGTACFGLTQELAKITDRLLFVIPKGRTSFPPEDKRARAPSPSVTPQGFELVSSAQGAQHTEATPTMEFQEDYFDDASHGAFQILGIQSPLKPYLSARGYDEALQDSHGTGPAMSGREDSEKTGTSPSHSESVRTGLKRNTTEDIDRDLESEAQSSPPDHDIYGRNLFEEVQRYSRLASRIARKERFDVIHCHDWMTFPAGMIAKRITGRPLIVHVHALEFDRAGDNIDERVYRIERLGLEAADRIIAVSDRTAQTIVTRYGIDRAKIRVVHNGVSSLPVDVPRRHKKVFEEKMVVFLGRITMQKGPEYFIESANMVRKAIPNVRFVMAGTGDLLPRMLLRSCELRLNPHFHFTGFINERERAKLFGQADLFVMTSISEPFGLTPGEAAQHDVPIIIPHQSGVSEIFNHAVKIDFWDTHRIADAIIHILQNPTLANQMVEGSRNDLRLANWESAAQKTRQLYNEVV